MARSMRCWKVSRRRARELAQALDIEEQPDFKVIDALHWCDFGRVKLYASCRNESVAFE